MPIGGRPPDGKCWANDSTKRNEYFTITEFDIFISKERLAKKPSYVQYINQRLAFDGKDKKDTPPNVNYCTNRQKRLIIYYKIFRDWWDNEIREDKSVWEILTLCIVQEVRKQFPDDVVDIEVARQEKQLTQHVENANTNPTKYGSEYNKTFDFTNFFSNDGT